MYVDSFAHPGRNVIMLEVEPGSSVADFGAGSGEYALALASAVGESGHVYAIDVQPDLLVRIKNEARRRELENMDIVVGDVSKVHGTKLRSHSVQLVLMSNVLFQLEHKRGAFDEAHRILEPKGRLAVIDWAEAVRDAERAHFHYTGEFPAGAHHYGLMFEAA